MIRVVVFSDIRLYREALRDALERLPDVVVSGIAATPAGIVALAEERAPDVAVVDVGTAGSAWVLEALNRRRVRLVALAVPDAAEAMMTSAEAGVVGYVGRDGSLEELVQAIREASRDDIAREPLLAATLVDGVRDDALTARELEVARLIAFEGLSNKQIAHRLSIALPTVKNHVHSVLGKLGASRRSEAAARLRNREPVRMG